MWSLFDHTKEQYNDELLLKSSILCSSRVERFLKSIHRKEIEYVIILPFNLFFVYVEYLETSWCD